MLWHKDTAPGGWHVLDGRELPIADHTALYNVITVNGTVFPYGDNTNGSGASGSTHFRLPDMTDLFVVGASSANVVGSTTGSNTHGHTFNASLPQINSSTSNHAHSYSPGNLANTGANHAHGVTVNFAENNAATNVKRAATGNTGAAFVAHNHSASANTNETGDHGHSITGGTGATNETGHAHTISFSFGSYSPSAIDSTPAHQRVYYIVFSGA